MVTKKEQFKCSVCGKLISARGVAGHERSKYHLDALSKQKGTKPIESNVQEIIQEPNNTGIQTTEPEDINDTNKDTRGQKGEQNDDTEEWDGYLC